MAKRATKTAITNLGSALPDWRGIEGYGDLLTRWRRVAAASSLPPVVLLHGRAGLGKKHLLTALAALVTCATRTACGRCDGCARLLSGQDPDVLWLDPAVPRLSVDHAAELQEHLAIAGACGVRVAVVGDVDRFSDHAMNRLLKTLEEPPANALILMSTSRVASVLETVRSRAVKIPIAPPPPAVTAAILRATWPGLADAEVNELLKRSGHAPGRALQLAAITLNAAKQDAAAELAHGNEAAQIVRQWELDRNERYWRRLDEGDKPLLQTELIEMKRQREVARSARTLAVRAKVALNPQLLAESLGLTKEKDFDPWKV